MGSLKRLNTARNSLCNVCAMVFYIHSKTACRGALVPCGHRSAPTEPAGETSPSAPASEKWLETVVSSHFPLPIFFSTRSGFPLLMLNFGLYFRIWRHPFLLFPSGTSSKEHQNSGVVFPSPGVFRENWQRRKFLSSLFCGAGFASRTFGVATSQRR